MNDEPDEDKRSSECRKSGRRTAPPRRIRRHIEILRREIPERPLSTDDMIRTEIGRFDSRGTPGRSHFNEVVNGKRRLHPALRTALHRAFGLDSLRIPLEVWDLPEPSLEETLARQVRKARSRFMAPLAWLRRLASSSGTIGPALGLAVDGGLLGIAVDAPGDGDAAVALTLGQSVRVRANLPFAGWLTVFNICPDVSDGRPLIHWIDPPLDNVLRHRPAGSALLPGPNASVPVGRPVGPNVLVAVHWLEKPSFDFIRRQEGVELIDESTLRKVLLSAAPAEAESSVKDKEKRYLESGVAVAILDYVVLSPDVM